MLKKEIDQIFSNSRAHGWVLEPDAKKVLSAAGLPIPKFLWATSKKAALKAAQSIGYPLAAKVVSPQVVHKSEVGGVVINIHTPEKLCRAFEHFSKMKSFAGMLVEEMVTGVELIVGAKNDFQFGPVVLLGIGGTGVEIYGDTAIRMAPLLNRDVDHMIASLRARKLLEGYRGAPPINKPMLTQLLIRFSEFFMVHHERIESIDLNPVMCSSESCVVADARIMLASA